MYNGIAEKKTVSYDKYYYQGRILFINANKIVRILPLMARIYKNQNYSLHPWEFFLTKSIMPK